MFIYCDLWEKVDFHIICKHGSILATLRYSKFRRHIFATRKLVHTANVFILFCFEQNMYIQFGNKTIEYLTVTIELSIEVYILVPNKHIGKNFFEICQLKTRKYRWDFLWIFSFTNKLHYLYVKKNICHSSFLARINCVRELSQIMFAFFDHVRTLVCTFTI